MNRHTLIAPLLVLALDIGVASAGTLVAASPLPVGGGDTYQCTLVNMGLKDIASVTASLAIPDDPAIGIFGSTTCAPLAPNSLCTASSSAVESGLRLCRALGKGNFKSLRGRFCNTTTGECVEMR